MAAVERLVLGVILEGLEQWPELKRALSTCASSEQAGEMIAAFLQRPDIPGKQALLEQAFVLALAQLSPALLGTEVGIACRMLFEAEPRGESEEEPSEGDDALNDWRGNSTCALLVRVLAETHEPHGGLAWSNDLVRRGYPTKKDFRKIEALQVEKDYELASAHNTTLEQVVNFCDLLQEHEYSPTTHPRHHRALAGVICPLLGRTATHAVLLRIARAGLLDYLIPALYPLGDNQAERSLAYQARVCDARASQSLGLPSAWHPFAISHLALCGLLADVVGVELASACIHALDEHGTLAHLEPMHVGLPGGGEENEWQWRCQEEDLC